LAAKSIQGTAEGTVNYPEDFPERLKNPVESAIAEADSQFHEVLSDVDAAPKVGFEGLVFRFVKKVLFTFAEQAREAVKQEAWTLERCRQGVDEYLHNLIVDAYREKNPSGNDDWLGFFEEWATEKIYASNEWRKHLKGIKALANAISAEAQPPSPPRSRRNTGLDLAGTHKAFVEPRLEAKNGETIANRAPSGTPRSRKRTKINELSGYAARSHAGLTHTKSESVRVHGKKAEPVQETVGQTIATQAPPTANSVMDRRAAVDAYIDEVFKKTGKRITRTDIWKAARYKSRTEFERWERKDPKHPNKTAHQHFTRILSDKPHLK